MNKLLWLIVILVPLGCLCDAQAADRKNVVRFGGVYVSPTGDLSGEDSFSEDLGDGTTLAFDGTLTVEPQTVTTLFVGYERRFTDLLGLEFTAWSGKHDVDGRLRGTAWLLDSNTGALISTAALDMTENLGEVSMTPLTAGVNFHLTPRSRVDVYVGPFLAYVLYGDFEVEGEESLAIDDDIALGGVIGLDIPLGRGGWVLTGAARYLDTKASPEDLAPGDDPLDVKPWVVQVSAGVRF